MNYRHAYHAGNFADVVKHCLLLQLLTQLAQKDKPFCVIDAYAGSGMYMLDSTEAQKTGEWRDGVGKVISLPQDNMPDAVASYARLVARAQKHHGKAAYPGSPWLIQQKLRAQDRAHAFELQSDEYQKLRRLFSQNTHMGVHQRDAFEGIFAMIPPTPKRGLVLIDPPFESEHKDFSALVQLLSQCHEKWRTGVYALWYPIKHRDVVDLFHKKMRRAAAASIKKQLICELSVYPDDAPIGLNGTGMLIINPPWQFSDAADTILQFLLSKLRRDNYAGTAEVRWL